MSHITNNINHNLNNQIIRVFDGGDICVVVENEESIQVEVGFQGPAGAQGINGVPGQTGPQGIPGPPGTLYVQQIVVDNTILTNKEAFLNFPLVGNPLQFELFVFGGTYQRPNVDFMVSTNRIYWNSLAL